MGSIRAPHLTIKGIPHVDWVTSTGTHKAVLQEEKNFAETLSFMHETSPVNITSLKLLSLHFLQHMPKCPYNE